MKRLKGGSSRVEVYEETYIVRKFKDPILFHRESDIYINFQQFCPKLIAMNNEDTFLIIEKCIPLVKTEKTLEQALKIIDILHRIFKEGLVHKDTVTGNIVIKNDEPLLIDWEYAEVYNKEYKTSPDIEDWYTGFSEGLGLYYKDFDQKIIQKALKKKI